MYVLPCGRPMLVYQNELPHGWNYCQLDQAHEEQQRYQMHTLSQYQSPCNGNEQESFCMGTRDTRLPQIATSPLGEGKPVVCDQPC